MAAPLWGVIQIASVARQRHSHSSAKKKKKKKLIRGWVGAAETGKHKNKERRGRLSTSCEVGAVETIPGMTALNPKSAGQRLNYRSFAGERMEMEVA